MSELFSQIFPASEWGDLEIRQQLGQGSFSQVYLAHRIGQPYAVKIVNPSAFRHREEVRVKFRKEAAYLAILDNPGIVKVFHVGEHRGKLYIISEYVDGPSLATLLSTHTKFPEETLVFYARAIALALATAHERFVIHRDIKPTNILINSHGEIKLIDFGFGFRQAGYADPAKQLVEFPDRVVGTLRYCAPEQTLMLKRPIDGRTDLYALGVVLFECASGIPPFQSSEVSELLRMHAVLPPPSLRAADHTHCARRWADSLRTRRGCWAGWPASADARRWR